MVDCARDHEAEAVARVRAVLHESGAAGGLFEYRGEWSEQPQGLRFHQAGAGKAAADASGKPQGTHAARLRLVGKELQPDLRAVPGMAADGWKALRRRGRRFSLKQTPLGKPRDDDEQETADGDWGADPSQWIAFGVLAHAGGAAARVDQYRLLDRKSTRLNSSHSQNSYAVFCLKKKNLRGVDFEAVQGKHTLLVGSSGCGKTTLISVIAGIMDKN